MNLANYGGKLDYYIEDFKGVFTLELVAKLIIHMASCGEDTNLLTWEEVEDSFSIYTLSEFNSLWESAYETTREVHNADDNVLFYSDDYVVIDHEV